MKPKDSKRLDSIKAAHQVEKTSSSSRVEDYLEIISELVELKGYATTLDISRYMNVSAPSVTKMLQRLDESGFKPLREVITMMLNSEVLVQTGLTTLLSTISLCSHKLEKIYIPKYEATEQSSFKTAFTIMSNKYNSSVNVKYIEHKNYIKAGEWRGRLDQSLRF